MKRIAFLTAITISALSFAQKTNTTNAAMAYQSYDQVKYTDFEQAAKDLLEAKTYIDLSIVHTETANDPKTLMYYGFIYIEIPICGELSGDATLKAFDPETTAQKGFDALKKSKELDVKGNYEDKIAGYCNFYRSNFSNAGIKMYEEGKYKEAMGGLIGAAIFGEAMGLKDSVFYYYGGRAAWNIQEWEEAKKAFTKTVEWGFERASSVYFLSQSYLKLGDTASAEKMLKEQVAKYPNDKDIMIELINLYIDTKRKPEAVAVLNAAIALDTKNAVLIFTAGTIYDNMGSFAEAEMNFLKAKELGDKNAGFSLGRLYFNKGMDLFAEAKTYTHGTPEFDANHDRLVAESKSYFEKALPILEQAVVDSPKDLERLEGLKACYGKLGLTDKFLEVKKKIEEIKAGQ